MFILGISCFYHDAAAALIQDGRLIAAAEEERFSRIKHDFDFPEHAIHFCLDQAKVGVNDLDYVVFYEKPFQKLIPINPPSDNTFQNDKAYSFMEIDDIPKPLVTEYLNIKNICYTCGFDLIFGSISI